MFLICIFVVLVQRSRNSVVIYDGVCESRNNLFLRKQGFGCLMVFGNCRVTIWLLFSLGEKITSHVEKKIAGVCSLIDAILQCRIATVEE
jgi:hypothetical protein